MKSQQLTSNIIRVAPKNLAKLKFSKIEVFEPGIELDAYVVARPPIITWEFKPDSLYSMFLINADASKLHQNLTQTQICRWLIVNIPENFINKGRTIINYNMPQKGQIINCGTERSILLIFKQNNIINEEKFIFDFDEGGCISVQSTDYVTRNDLGKLIAGNYFKVKF